MIVDESSEATGIYDETMGRGGFDDRHRDERL
jgi:hypothetical protein